MSDGGVTLTIDGKEITTPPGTLIIRAAEQLGIEIPRFCDHPLLEPIGACRQCYVEVEGQRKLFTSCTTPVAEGMVVKTQNTSEQARQAQVANLEFLLLNHPLDCPVCDRGGECPLQDQTLSHGPGESRYIEAKRTYEKPIALSPLVALDRERCVLCARCTRFCDEISGDRFIELFDRGAWEQVSIAPGEDFESPFSGNTIQICPVGALTAVPYRFAARPFDLKTADTICPHCSAGCNIRVDERRGEVVRVLARENLEVNDEWICDKGRFAFRYVDSPNRLTTPLVRRKGLEPASWEEAFAAIAEASKGKRVAFLTGGRLCDEDYYALSKLARTVFKTNDLDFHAEFSGGQWRLSAAGATDVTYRDVERAKVILVFGVDAEQEIPILHLRIRKAARRGARVFVVHSRRTRLWDVAEHLLCRPGEEAATLHGAAAIRQAITAAGRDAVIIAGQGAAKTSEAALELANEAGARFAHVYRRANDHGALRAGVRPDLLPGGRAIHHEAERGEIEAIWGPVPIELHPVPPDLRERIEATGSRVPDEGIGHLSPSLGILRDAAERRIDVLYLVAVDPLTDFPHAKLAQRALENVEFKVVQDISHGDYDIFADVMLPAAAFMEREGHYTTWEGRGQRLRPVRGPLGVSRPDWEIFTGIAQEMGHPLGWSTLEELQEEMGPLVAPRKLERRHVTYFQIDERMEYGLTLFTYPLLVDEGRLSEGADELKAAQEQQPFVEVHPDDAKAAGLDDGGEALVKTEAGEARLPVRVTEHIAKGAVFVPYNQPGFRANTLLSGSFTTAVTLEPVTADEPAEANA